MNPKRVRTLHDGIEIPPIEPDRPRDPYRALRVWSWVVLVGAPLCTLLLINDFLWLPNGNGRYSTVAALRDELLLGRGAAMPGDTVVRTGLTEHPVYSLVLWQDEDGWHADSQTGARGRGRMQGGTRVASWDKGGDLFVTMPVPDTRVGLWAGTSELKPYIEMWDPMNPMVTPATLPAEAVSTLREAIVELGGEEAGVAFDGATPTWVGMARFAITTRRLVPLGVLHNLFALAMLLGALVGWALWPGTLRRYRRYRRGLCFGCAYHLAGVTHPRCPECGQHFKRSAAYPS